MAVASVSNSRMALSSDMCQDNKSRRPLQMLQLLAETRAGGSAPRQRR